MAERESSLTPGRPIQRPDYFTTPDSWEMRADMQTPANLRGGPPESAWSEATDGLSNSFNMFDGYGMYETPPGALLYRNQFDESCGDGSFNSSTREDEMEVELGDKYETEQEVIPDERCDVPNGIEDREGDASENPEESSQQVSENSCGQVCSSAEEVPKNPALELEESLTESNMLECSEKENICLSSVTSLPEDIPKLASEGIESDKVTNTMRTEEQNEIEECIFEQMDRQEEEQRRQTRPSFEGYQSTQHQIALSDASPPPCSHEVNNDVEENIGCSGQVLDTSNKHLDVSHIPTTETLSSDPYDIIEAEHEVNNALENSIGCSEHISNTSNIPGEDTCEATRIPEADRYSSEPYEIIEAGYEVTEPEDKVGTEIHNNDINASLMIMDITQNAAELDQLADFLKMDDPFQNQDEKHVTLEEAPREVRVEETTDIDSGIILAEHNDIQSEREECKPSPKRTRRKRKPAAASERRRSVRIARRESLQPATSAEPELPEKQTGSIKMDVNPNEQCSHFDAKSDTVSSSREPVPVETDTFEHVNIDLPMTKRGAPKRNSRRRSVRLHKKDMKMDVLENADACNETQTNTETKVAGDGTCDRVLLADFADFGLGDDWMPGNMFGENQFSKTPKKTPGTAGRRKSARLSGVPMPMLELHRKSTVKVSGKDGMNVDDMHQNIKDEGCMQETASGQVAGIPIIPSNLPSSIPQDDPLENLGELPLEQLDAPVAKPKGRKKRTVNARRRSVRLAKKPQMITENEEDGRIDSQAEGSNLANQQVSLDTVCGEVTQDILAQNNTSNEIENHETLVDPPISPVELPTERTESDMEWQQQELKGGAAEAEDTVLHEPAAPLVRRTKQVAKDTPLMGRKRVSRIGDTTNDDVGTMASASQDKENKGAGVPRTPEAAAIERKVLSPNNGIKITKKIKQLYLNKGQDMKKHKAVNLETIFESPIVRGKGQQAMAIGAKRMKRLVAFTETPWLGRPGRTKGGKKKTKKGKEVKRVLSSQKERCWKLDTMLSTLDYLSP